MLFELANKLTRITGGVDGLQGIEMKPIFGLFSFDLYGKTAYIYSVAVLFILFWIARRIVNSPFGLSLRGIRLNVLRMPALGAPVNARLVGAYNLFILEVVAAWRDPAQKRPKTIHHHGYGTFVVDGPRFRLKSKMR
jgi:hypothetical protein